MVLESNQLVEIITQSVNTIVVVTDKKGELLYVSDSVERILGFKSEDLVGQYWWNVANQEDQSLKLMFDMFKDLIQMDGTSQLTTEKMIFDSLGRKKWILWSSTIDENKKCVSVGYDITSRKKNEAKLKRANALLTTKNSEILDSLKYAQSIQNAILPSTNYLKSRFNDGFVFYEPKDFVSGDFYWFHEIGNLFFVVCIDCTGHGVPGALMTILANSLLKNIIKQQKLRKPADILHAIDEMLYDDFNRNNKMKRSDGMDLSLALFDFDSNMMCFSGANHSIFIKKNGSPELLELKGQRYPIGLYHDVKKEFKNSDFIFEKGDQFFLFTDGILDQFGGDKNKKFTKTRFKNSLGYVEIKIVENQISTDFKKWKNKNEQTDDVLVIGLEI